MKADKRERDEKLPMDFVRKDISKDVLDYVLEKFKTFDVKDFLIAYVYCIKPVLDRLAVIVTSHPSGKNLHEIKEDLKQEVLDWIEKTGE